MARLRSRGKVHKRERVYALSLIALVLVATLRLGSVEWHHILLVAVFIPTIVMAVRHGQIPHYEAHRMLQYQATHDALTGLPNRELFHERLREAMQFVSKSEGHFALAMVDLDGFKAINDRHGHLAGDVLLQAMAERLRSSVRASDTVARFGGDEFVLLLKGVTNGPALMERCEQLRLTLEQPHRFISRDGHACVRVSASIGIALGANLDADQLIQKADQALYQAKANGKNSCVLSS